MILKLGSQKCRTAEWFFFMTPMYSVMILAFTGYGLNFRYVTHPCSSPTAMDWVCSWSGRSNHLSYCSCVAHPLMQRLDSRLGRLAKCFAFWGGDSSNLPRY